MCCQDRAVFSTRIPRRARTSCYPRPAHVLRRAHFSQWTRGGLSPGLPRVPSHALAQRRGDAALRGGGRELPPAVFAAASQENPTGMVPGLGLTQGPPVPPPALVVAGATGKHKECCSAKGSVMSFIGNTSRRSEMCYSNVFWTSWWFFFTMRLRWQRRISANSGPAFFALQLNPHGMEIFSSALMLFLTLMTLVNL